MNTCDVQYELAFMAGTTPVEVMAGLDQVNAVIAVTMNLLAPRARLIVLRMLKMRVMMLTMVIHRNRG